MNMLQNELSSDESYCFEQMNAPKGKSNTIWESMNVKKTRANEEEAFPKAMQAFSKMTQGKSGKEMQLWNKKDEQTIKNGLNKISLLMNSLKEKKNSNSEEMNVMKTQANKEEGFPRSMQAFSKMTQGKSRKEWQLWNKEDDQTIKNG